VQPPLARENQSAQHPAHGVEVARDDDAGDEQVATLLDRMPVIVAPARYASWLDPGLTDPAAVRGLLTPTRPDLLAAYPVDAAVGNVANNGPQLTDPAWTPASGR